MVAKTPHFAAAIACLVAGSDAFSPSLTGNSVAVNSFRNQVVGPLFLVGAGDGPEDGTTLTSARKEIAYDAASGR